jgi:hypothetical protein
MWFVLTVLPFVLVTFAPALTINAAPVTSFKAGSHVLQTTN